MPHFYGNGAFFVEKTHNPAHKPPIRRIGLLLGTFTQIRRFRRHSGRKCDNKHSMRGLLFCFVLALLAIAGCGYHTLGSAAHMPDTVHTLAVPIFKNKTQFYHTEVPMTQAVVREFTDRTRLNVMTSSNDERTPPSVEPSSPNPCNP